MIHDPLFPSLVHMLRERGWIELDDALYAPHETIWVDLSVNWPATVKEQQEIIQRRFDRISRLLDYSEFDNENWRRIVSDTSDLLKVLDDVLATQPTTSG